jgi:hypothetical protein
MPRASPIRLRPLSWGGTTPPSPSPPDVSPPTRRVRGDLAVRRQHLPSASCGCPYAAPLIMAACGSGVTRAFVSVSSALTAFASVPPGRAAPAAQPLRPQAPVRAARACGLPTASSAGQPLARLGAVPGGARCVQGGPRGACGPTPAQCGAVVGGKNRLIFLYSGLRHLLQIMRHKAQR